MKFNITESLLGIIAAIFILKFGMLIVAAITAV